MEARMGQPAMVVPGAMQASLDLNKAVHKAGLSDVTAKLVHLRVSQINGCGVCVHMHSHELVKLGESQDRIFTVAAWRESPYFTDAERVALELAEAVTRLADRPDPVSDELWQRVAKHYNERELGALLLSIGAINVWNRLNAATRQVAGVYKP